MTVISHDSESRTYVKGYEAKGSYSRDIRYTGASLSQLASLTRVSSNCEQFIKYECTGSALLQNGHFYGWWVSRDSANSRLHLSPQFPEGDLRTKKTKPNVEK